MPVLLSYGSPAVRASIRQNGSSPPGAETSLKDGVVEGVGSIRRKKSADQRLRRLRVVRNYNIPGNSGYISSRDDGDDKIHPSKGGPPAPSVTPASVALPAQALPPSSNPATKQVSTPSQTQSIATHTSSIVSSSATVRSYMTETDDAGLTTSYSSSYTKQKSVSSTSITSHSTSTSDQYYEGETSSSTLGAFGATVSPPSTTLATSQSYTLPGSTMSMQQVSQPSNMVTLKPGALSPDQNAAITGGTIGGIAAFLGLIFLIFLFRRNRWFESLKRFASSRRKKDLFKGKSPSDSISRQISAPLEPPSNPPMASTMTWNYEETFAEPSVPPPSRLSRIFRGPLSLHPPTPPPLSPKFQAPESLARTVFKNSHISIHTMPSPTQPKRASVHTRSSLALPHRYDRLPSFSFTGEDTIDSEERRAMSYFSRPSTVTTRPRSPPSAGRRQSHASMKSTDSEPARFRSVPSWVNHQSQRQTWISQRGVDLEENPVPEIPEASRHSVKNAITKTTSVKREPVRSVIQSRKKTQGDEGEGRANMVFEEHPGTRVEVPGLYGKRIRSTVLDRNIWGWEMNR